MLFSQKVSINIVLLMQSNGVRWRVEKLCWHVLGCASSCGYGSRWFKFCIMFFIILFMGSVICPPLAVARVSNIETKLAVEKKLAELESDKNESIDPLTDKIVDDLDLTSETPEPESLLEDIESKSLVEDNLNTSRTGGRTYSAGADRVVESRLVNLDESADYRLPTYTGPREIYHPLAKKGLVKITREKIYLYKTPVSKQNRSSSFRFGSYTLNNLSDPDQRVFFDEIYTDSDPTVLLYDYVWQRKFALGRWGWKLGTGIFVGTGKGRFASNGKEAREKFTFIMAPNSAAMTVQLRFWDKQPIIPIAEVGLDLFTAIELRDDDRGPKAGGGLGAHAAGGLAFNLGVLDRHSVINLDREYGINDIYIVVEFRQVIKLSSVDFSGSAFTGGFMAEF